MGKLLDRVLCVESQGIGGLNSLDLYPWGLFASPTPGGERVRFNWELEHNWR